MSLAKPFFDVGLFTNQRDAQQQFWAEQAGLPFDHSLKLGGGVLQHRYTAGQAVLKLNDARDPLPAAYSPIQCLSVAVPGLTEVQQLTDPDGNAIRLVPEGFDGIHGLAVELQVASIALSEQFYSEVLGCVLLQPGVLACGEAQLRLNAGGPAVADLTLPLAATGMRYLTLQVFDCDQAYAAALAAGASAAREPVTLGTTARIAFIRDPDGLWIELSERASVTGKAV